MKLSNDFSWSIQRDLLFQRCKREYYYHYYGSWNGWDETNDSRINLIYRLKNIKTESAWVESIVKRTLLSAIKREIEFTFSSCKSYSIRLLYKDISELEHQEYLKDPKKICIDSVYFNLCSSSELKQTALKEIEIIWDFLWQDETFCGLTKIRYGDFLKVGEFGEFKLNGIRIWCNPLCIYSLREFIYVMDIHVSNTLIAANYSLSATLLNLYTMHEKHLDNRHVVPQLIVVGKNGLFEIQEFLPEEEVIDRIRKSSLQMQMCLTQENDSYEENFLVTERQEQCYRCRFREICNKD